LQFESVEVIKKQISFPRKVARGRKGQGEENPRKTH